MTKNFSYSQALLALAIGLLALSIFRFTTHLPEIITVVDKTTTVVESFNPKVDTIIEEVSQVRALVSEQTPKILAKVDSTLPVIKQVVLESGHYSSQLPTFLAELAKIEAQVALLQKSMPDILKRVDAVVKTTQTTTDEVALWRPHSSQYIKEIELSREYIPQYLTRIENTVVDAKTIGSEASSGIVSGFVKGVINLPFEMVSGLTGIVEANSKSAKNLTVEDITLMQEKTVALLHSDNQTTAAWENAKTGNRGMITKGKKTTRRGEQCIKVTFNNHFTDDNETINKLMCVDDEGLWRVI